MKKIGGVNYKTKAAERLKGRMKEMAILFLSVILGVLISVSLNS